MILEPFVGSGTIALEAYMAQRNVICSDINPYAVALTRAKLNPPRDLFTALTRLSLALQTLDTTFPERRFVPKWVRSFFHHRTLSEADLLSQRCIRAGDFFTLACLLGILHHQRPGFLSYPSNHLVPYLLSKKYPRTKFPSMYRYRALGPRLVSKVKRAYRNFPTLDESLIHKCYNRDGLTLPLREGSIDAIITSPPYMDNLDYVRDNRLRLWFLGLEERYMKNQEHFSPDEFRTFLMRSFLYFKRVLKEGGLCVLVLGDVNRDKRHYQCARLAKEIALKKLGLFRLHEQLKYPLPEIRRSRHYRQGTTSETILVLQSKKQ